MELACKVLAILFADRFEARGVSESGCRAHSPNNGRTEYGSLIPGILHLCNWRFGYISLCERLLITTQ